MKTILLHVCAAALALALSVSLAACGDSSDSSSSGSVATVEELSIPIESDWETEESSPDGIETTTVRISYGGTITMSLIETDWGFAEHGDMAPTYRVEYLKSCIQSITTTQEASVYRIIEIPSARLIEYLECEIDGEAYKGYTLYAGSPSGIYVAHELIPADEFDAHDQEVLQILREATIKNGYDTDADLPTSTITNEDLVDASYAAKLEREARGDIVKLKAKYEDNTEEGTVVDEDSDITVRATYEDGTSETVYGWEVKKPATLKEGKTSEVTITYEGAKATLKVKGTVKVTTGMLNALSKAGDYLDYMPFSKSGLKDQLEYEGYTSKEAQYAVDNCGADWKEQAYLHAKRYLDYTSFSLSGLIDQLEYEGYTYEQASYGAKKAYK